MSVWLGLAASCYIKPSLGAYCPHKRACQSVPWRTLAPTVITLSTLSQRGTSLLPLRRFPAMTTFIIGIFVAIIIGAACAFDYVVYADDSGRTGP
jgi:hypothetical protein